MRILIIEDEQQLAKTMALSLKRQGFSADITGCAEDGLFLLISNKYDTLLLDLNLPDRDGIDVLEEVRGVSDIPVIIVTARDQVCQRTNGLNKGADDYITKPFDMLELGSRIHAVIRRSYGHSSDDLRIGLLLLKPTIRTAFWDGLPLELSLKEYTILECLCLNYPTFISAENILTYAYDDSVDPFSSVIRVHISNLRKKLPRKLAVDSMKGIGYRLCVK